MIFTFVPDSSYVAVNTDEILISEYMTASVCSHKDAVVLRKIMSSGARTIGQFLAMGPADIRNIASMGRVYADRAVAIQTYIRANSVWLAGWHRRQIAKHDGQSAASHFIRKASSITLPSADASSLVDRAMSVVRGIIAAYQAKGKSHYAEVCRLAFLEGMTATEIYTRASLGICKERVRQIINEVSDRMYNNAFAKLGINIEASFIEAISEIRKDSENKPLCILKSHFGNDVPVNGLASLLGLEIVADNSYAPLAQDYVISRTSDVSVFRANVKAIVSTLLSNVLPMSEGELKEKLEDNGYFMTSGFLTTLLDSHLYIERNGDLYQGVYQYLTEYQRAARIVWERGRVTRRELNSINAERMGRDEVIDHSLNVAQQKYEWCRPQGRSGVWFYSPDGSRSLGIRGSLRHFVSMNGVFSIQAARNYLESIGICYEERTLRAYLTEMCRVATCDANIFCGEDKVSQFQSIRWRNRRSSAKNASACYAL